MNFFWEGYSNPKMTQLNITLSFPNSTSKAEKNRPVKIITVLIKVNKSDDIIEYHIVYDMW